MEQITVCITTINKPTFFSGSLNNAKKYNYRDYNIIIIGDYKSPKDNKAYINGLAKKYKVDIRYLSVEDQKKLLKKYKLLDSILPYNWGGRKCWQIFYLLRKNPK